MASVYEAKRKENLSHTIAKYAWNGMDGSEFNKLEVVAGEEKKVKPIFRYYDRAA